MYSRSGPIKSKEEFQHYLDEIKKKYIEKESAEFIDRLIQFGLLNNPNAIEEYTAMRNMELENIKKFLQENYETWRDQKKELSVSENEGLGNQSYEQNLDLTLDINLSELAFEQEKKQLLINKLRIETELKILEEINQSKAFNKHKTDQTPSSVIRK